METYQGVKFRYLQVGEEFTCGADQLATLHHWAYLFSQLGLTPVHAEGAYGNQSCRTGSSSFFITKSGMHPSENFDKDSFCHVTAFDKNSDTFLIEGKAVPSSESMLHAFLYNAQPDINAILHGHSRLFMHYADRLGIPTTHAFHPYGTRDLAESAVACGQSGARFFILKDHGFVAMGDTITSAGKLTLSFLAKVINLIASSANSLG